MATLEEWIGLYYSTTAEQRVAAAEGLGKPVAPKPKSKLTAVSAPALTIRVKPKATAKQPTVNACREENETLLETLKTWRRKVATDLSLPPYMVFSDKTLINIAYYTPSTPEELLTIHGIGGDKMEKYGETIISMVAAEVDA